MLALCQLEIADQAKLLASRQACGPPSCSQSRPTVHACQQITSRGQLRLRAKAIDNESTQIQLPDSRKSAVEQACAAAIQVLDTRSATKSRKNFKGQQLRKLALELPVADDSVDTAVQLALDFCKVLPARIRDSLCVVSAPEVAKVAGKELAGVTFVSADARRLPTSARYVLLVGLEQSQISDAKRLFSSCRAEAALLLTPSPDRGSDKAVHSFLASFDTTYCFEPIAIKAFVLTTDGVVYKNGMDAPWKIMKRDLFGKHKSIGQMKTRPQQDDLEAAFLNAAAVDSPVNKGIGAVKNLFARR